MKKIVTICFASLAIVLLTACGGRKATEIHPVAGTIDEPLGKSVGPQKVQDAIVKWNGNSENLLNDTANNLSVWSFVVCDTNVYSDGYGIIIVYNGITTLMPNIYHGKNPTVRYDAASGNLWLACGEMEGTGVHTERLYLLRLGDNDIAYVASCIESYDVQQSLIGRLGYSVDGDRVSLYDGDLLVATFRNVLDGATPRLLVTPGVKLTSSPSFAYDDTPTLAADVTLDSDDTFTLGPLGIVEQ